MEIVNLPIQKIKPDTEQPRQTLDQERIKEMAQSIKTEGVINPIEVDKNNVIITGEMRWRAATEAGLTEIPCKIIAINAGERFRRQVIENIHHNTMTEWDTAKALARLLNWRPGRRFEGGRGNAGGIHKLAKEIGKSRDFISDRLEILEAPKGLQEGIRTGQVPYTFLRAYKRTPKEYQQDMEQKIITGGFRTREDAREAAEALVRTPEKAEQILAAKDTQAIVKISPRVSDKIRESYNPVNELSDIVDKLVEWTKNNPPQTIGAFHAARIIFNLNGAVAAINAWGEKVTQLKLEKGKN